VGAALLALPVSTQVQIALWAGAFVLSGEFTALEEAFYHSAVNFTTLGYGDIVMSRRWRLLGPLEAINGSLMLGLLANLSHHLARANATLSVTSSPRPPWRACWLCL
jgi:hypothetical protein